MLVTLVLSYLAIGSLLWALVIAGHGFGNCSRTAAVVVSCGSILAWPVFVLGSIVGGARVKRARRRAF